MTRFLLNLDEAIDTIFDAIREARRGEIYVPRIPAARVTDIADIMIGNRKIPKNFIGIRPGEKIHEVLISEEESHRTVTRGKYYVIQPILPEIRQERCGGEKPETEFSSANCLLSKEDIAKLLQDNSLLPEMQNKKEGELLR
jgi:UDP-glucose 4-epimerase